MRLQGRLFRDILRVGAPLSLQPILNNVALTLLTFYAGTLGQRRLAGIGAAVRLEYLMYPIVFGLGAAVVAMVGTNIGAGQVARATRIAWIAAGLAAAVTGIVGGIAAIWPKAWIVLFSASPEVAAAAATYSSSSRCPIPLIGMNTLTQAFQAMGQTLWPLMAVLSRALIIIVGGWMAITMNHRAASSVSPS